MCFRLFGAEADSLLGKKRSDILPPFLAKEREAIRSYPPACWGVGAAGCRSPVTGSTCVGTPASSSGGQLSHVAGGGGGGGGWTLIAEEFDEDELEALALEFDELDDDADGDL